MAVTSLLCGGHLHATAAEAHHHGHPGATALFVSNLATNVVLRFNGSTGTFVDTFLTGGGLAQPGSFTFGPDQHLYVTSFYTKKVVRFDGHTGAGLGDFVAPASGGLTAPTAMAFGPDGHFYVCSFGTHSVLRYDGHTGQFLDVFVAAGSGGLAGASGLAFGPDGHLYVSSIGSNSVLRYHGHTGAFLNTCVASGSGGLRGAFGLRFGPDRHLYVSSLGTGEVLHYHGRTGQFRMSLSSMKPAASRRPWIWPSGLTITYMSVTPPTAPYCVSMGARAPFSALPPPAMGSESRRFSPYGHTMMTQRAQGRGAEPRTGTSVKTGINNRLSEASVATPPVSGRCGDHTQGAHPCSSRHLHDGSGFSRE